MDQYNALKQKKLFLFDIDGTIAVGDTLYEGSAELLDYIERIGGKAFFQTGSRIPRKPAQHRAITI